LLRLAALAANADDLPRSDLGDVLDVEAVGFPAIEVAPHRALDLVVTPDEIPLGARGSLVPADGGTRERKDGPRGAVRVGLKRDLDQFKGGRHPATVLLPHRRPPSPDVRSMAAFVYSTRQWPNGPSASRAARQAPTSFPTRPSVMRRPGRLSPTGRRH